MASAFVSSSSFVPSSVRVQLGGAGQSVSSTPTTSQYVQQSVESWLYSPAAAVGSSAVCALVILSSKRRAQRQQSRRGKRHVQVRLAANGNSSKTSPLLQTYDPPSQRKYFSTKPVRVISRVTEIAKLGFAWVQDFQKNRKDPTQTERLALRLVDVLTALGPSFVKLGQVVSSRVDLLSAEYISALKSLTDRVEPFPYEVAKGILAEEWTLLDGPCKPSDLPEIAAASASLGQVYRVETPSGQVLAVKVQRPGVREQICLDLFIVRSIVPWLQNYLGLNTDLAALVDEYGTRFVAELDYTREAQSAVDFQEAMTRIGFDAVCVANPLSELTTEKVLVSEWIEGERIDAEKSKEGARLCGVALTAYLIMLLETGQLHADPHPGNLLRTTDGRLCILDWGMVTKVTSEQQDTIIAYFTHILSEDYDAIPKDLVKLGFIAAGNEGSMNDKLVSRAIASAFQALAAGGGARKQVADLLPEFQEVRRRYGNIGQLPAYFAYILRAFSVLEGIGLEQDPDYAIVSDCYPYLVSRLMREDGQRAKDVLEALVYGPVPGRGSPVVLSGSGVEPRPPLNAPRVIRLINAFRAYMKQMDPAAPSEKALFKEIKQGLALNSGTARTPTHGSPQAEARQRNKSEENLMQVRRLLRSTALQEVFEYEIARFTDVLSREALNAGPIGFLVPPRTAEDEAVMGSLQEILADINDNPAMSPPTPQEALEFLLKLSAEGALSAPRLVKDLVDARPHAVAGSLRIAAALLERATARPTNA